MPNFQLKNDEPQLDHLPDDDVESGTRKWPMEGALVLLLLRSTTLLGGCRRSATSVPTARSFKVQSLKSHTEMAQVRYRYHDPLHLHGIARTAIR